MHVLVTGATGFIGSHLVDALLRAGYAVIACARRSSALANRFPQASAIQMDFAQPKTAAQWTTLLRGVEVVINTVGIIAESGAQTFEALHVQFPRALFEACHAAGVRRVIQVSALGAEVHASSAYHRSKYAADTCLRSLGLEYSIVKPSLVFGRGGRSLEFFSALAAQPVHILIDHGAQAVQPIHIDDLVNALMRLVSEKTPPADLAAVGPTAISFREMLAAYRRWLGYRSGSADGLRVISIPLSLALAATKLPGLGNNSFLRADNIRMLTQGNTASARVITALLEYEPVSFHKGLLKDPATDADRWHARLYFLLPWLRWVVAFVWIYSGIISALVFPRAASYELLRPLGLSGWMLPVSLYGAAVLDLALGIAVLLRYRPYFIGLMQIAVIGAYTLIISIFLPQFWLHPFGPLIKNFPFVLLILVMLAVEHKTDHKVEHNKADQK